MEKKASNHNSKIDIRSGMLFPWHFLFMAAVVFIAALSMIAERTVLSLVLAGASAVILSGYSGTEIDIRKNFYREYRSFLFIKSGTKVSFTRIEKIYINRSKVTQTMYTARTNHSAVFSDVEYNAWLKFDDETRIHLCSKKNHTKLMKVVRNVAAFLKTRVEDQAIPATVS